MARARTIPEDHPAFADLPVQMIATADPAVCAAVHVSAPLARGTLPIVGLAGLQRNISDFSAFAAYFCVAQKNRPLILIDLPGRGRANDRRRAEDYGSLADARDVADILAALGVSRAIFLGQGHGGQVVMALAAAHRLLVAGTILLDAGPVTDSRGIVRLRNNLTHIDGLRGAKSVAAGLRRILASDYPGVAEEVLGALAQRSHFIDKRGRAQPLFDRRLVTPLLDINFDDVLAAQWPLYDALAGSPLMLLRTQLTDQLRRETFDEMVRRRPDALALMVAGQGSPALFDQPEELAAVAEFVATLDQRAARAA